MSIVVDAKDASVTSLERNRQKKKKPAPAHSGSRIPDDILEDAKLTKAIAVLPSNYSFEIRKTIWRMRTCNASRVALQFPEGLLMYACLIADILEEFGPEGVDTVIMGDVTYGACCVDDFTARGLGADFFVHYGHSCLVPVTNTSQDLNMLYVFVDIQIDIMHFCKAVRDNFKPKDRIYLAGTIQFASSLHTAKQSLSGDFPNLVVPQGKPLSHGEVLGCTSPLLPQGPSSSSSSSSSAAAAADDDGGGLSEQGVDIVLFLADGRFHLESMMIQNPHIKAFYKYDPYNQKLTREEYGHVEMKKIRQHAIDVAVDAKHWGVILGTLGRQGNPVVLERILAQLRAKNLEFTVVLMSEIFPDKLARLSGIDAWIQVACPRLSIDWGYAFTKPLLSAYEAHLALQRASLAEVYPMDFYRSTDTGPWSNKYKTPEEVAAAKARAANKPKPKLRRKKKKKTPVVVQYES